MLLGDIISDTTQQSIDKYVQTFIKECRRAALPVLLEQ